MQSSEHSPTRMNNPSVGLSFFGGWLAKWSLVPAQLSKFRLYNQSCVYPATRVSAQLNKFFKMNLPSHVSLYSVTEKVWAATYMHTYRWLYSTHTYTHTRTHTQTRTHTYAHTHTHARESTCTHTHAHITHTSSVITMSIMDVGWGLVASVQLVLPLRSWLMRSHQRRGAPACMGPFHQCLWLSATTAS